jgi:hypothetical protein
MALPDLHRARRGAALLVAALAALPTLTVDLPGEALYRLRTDRSLRTFTGLFERVTHGALDLTSADLPQRLVRPSAATADWLLWQWFGLEAPLHRAALLALLALCALALRAAPDRDDRASILLGAAFVAHPVTIDALATLQGRGALFALVAGLATTRLTDAHSRASTVALTALGAFAVVGADAPLAPWFAALALASRADRRAVLGGLALGVVAASPALVHGHGVSLAALGAMAWRALRVTIAPVGLDAWASIDAPSWPLTLAALGVWSAVASLAWRRGARVEAVSSSLLLAGAVFSAAAHATVSGARVDAELLAAVYAVVSLVAALLATVSSGAQVALALSLVMVGLGARRAVAWRDGVSLARASLDARPRDGRVALSLAFENLRHGRADAGCRRALEDPAVRGLALACVAVEAAVRGRLDEARGAVSAYRATPRSDAAGAWDFGRVLSLRPHDERTRLKRTLDAPTGGAP